MFVGWYQVLTNSSALLQESVLVVPAHHDVPREDVTLWHLGEHPPGVPRLPEPGDHVEHGVPETEADSRVRGVGVLAGPYLGILRAASLAEVKERHVGVLVGRLRGGLEMRARAPAAAGRARRSQLRADA